MGDPAGCGPEVIAQVAASGAAREMARIVCVGDARVMERAFRTIEQPVPVRATSKVTDAGDEPGTLDVLDLDNVDLARVQIGSLKIGNLPLGRWRILHPEELRGIVPRDADAFADRMGAEKDLSRMNQ